MITLMRSSRVTCCYKINLVELVTAFARTETLKGRASSSSAEMSKCESLFAEEITVG